MLFTQRGTGESRITRFVFGFYRSEEHGEEALREARKSGFRRSAVIHRAADGGLKHFHDGRGPRERAIFGLTLALSVAVAALTLNLPPIDWPLLILGGALMLGAFLAGWFGTLWLGVGLRDRVLHGFRGLALPGESLVVIEAGETEMADVIAMLRRIAQPAVFAMRPGPRFPAPEVSKSPRLETATMAGLPDRATELALTHEVESSTRSRSLLPILLECEVLIESSRAGLAESARLEYAVTHEAEWLLDNAYLIRSNIADIRHNLPDNHNKILPVLKNRNSAVRLRVYQLAVALIDGTGHRLTAEAIVSFLEAYQSRAPLTIGELWVFPLMLRLVLIERLRGLSELASLRQHEKELADFWADRMLNAAQRSPALLAEMIDELDRRGTKLTPHFIERLSEQLHQEESTLAPIQSWIQERTGLRLVDIIRGEQADEANDLMLISGAIGSLRQLSELQYPKIVEAVSRMEAILREDPSGIHARSDFATRDRCRRMVESVARESKRSEWDVARLAVELAQRASEGSRERCVAYYLLDDGLPETEKRVRRRLLWRERSLRLVLRHRTLLYLGGLAALTASLSGSFLYAAYSAGVTSPGMLLFLGILAMFPASELATYLLQVFLTWILPPRVLPKMWFEEGIPDECRTLVVVPMMLLTPDAVAGEIDKLAPAPPQS